MSTEKLNKVMTALERLANAEGYPLEVSVDRPRDVWMITFRAGRAAIQTQLISFAAAPKIVLDPFCEQMIKQIKGEI